jgi:hypothetical protein
MVTHALSEAAPPPRTRSENINELPILHGPEGVEDFVALSALAPSVDWFS